MAGENLEELRNLLGAGHDIPAGNINGMRSGVFQNGRELTAAEGLWQQRNAEAHADYNQRKADRETRRALNVDPSRSGAATSLASIYKDRAQTYKDSAKNLMEARAGSAASAIRNRLNTVGYGDDPGAGMRPQEDALKSLVEPAGGTQAANFANEELKKQYDEAIAAIRSAISAPGGTPASNGADNLSTLALAIRGESSAPKPMDTGIPDAPVQVTAAPSVFGNGDAFGYDYGGIRVELPGTVDTNDPAAVKRYADLTNQMIDWMNNDNEEGLI